MEIAIEIVGDIAERSELLNGTETIALEGASEDGWTLAGLASWSIGLVEYAGEGDITLTIDHDAIFGTAVSVVVRGSDDGGEELSVRYEIDGGEGRFESVTGTIEARARLDGAAFAGRWTATLD